MPFFKLLSCVKKNKASLDEIPYHKFQIGNSNGMKWKSSGAQLHDKVSLIMSVEKPEYWRVEKEVDTPFWSFHVLSKNGKKLYVSYDDNSNDITLEFKNDSKGGKRRLFEALLQNNMEYILRAHDSRNRYIRSNEGKLEMITTDVPVEHIRWMIKERLDEIEGQEQKHKVEIQYTAQKWISSGSRSDQPVPVGQTGGLEKWMMSFSGKPGIMMFSVCTEPKYFASCTKLHEQIMFYDDNTESQMRIYKPNWQGFGCKLQNMSSCDWVTISTDQTLMRKKDEKDAVVWEVVEMGIPYRRDDDIFWFPPEICENED